MVLNAAIGALLGLVVYSLTDGMPVWIAAALAVALAIGGGIGAVLASPIERLLGLSTGLIATALIAGEAFAGAGTIGSPDTPLPAIVLAGIGFVMFAAWHRLSASIRRRIVPPQQLGRVKAGFQAAGLAGVLAGGALAAGYLWLLQTYGLFGGNYVAGVLVAAGILVVVAGLLGIPAMSAEPPKPGARIATVIATLVIPALAGGLALVRYAESRNDFSAAPDICATDVVSQEQVEKFIEDPPERETQQGSESGYVTCEWRQASGDVAELRLDVTKYDNARAAAHELQYEREQADEDGEILVDFELGDEATRRWYDGSIDSEDTVGVALQVRIDNLVLEVDYDRTPDLGTLEEADSVALATELVEEIERRR